MALWTWRESPDSLEGDLLGWMPRALPRAGSGMPVFLAGAAGRIDGRIDVETAWGEGWSMSSAGQLEVRGGGGWSGEEVWAFWGTGNRTYRKVPLAEF